MMRKAKIEIEGMHCASCSANVEKALSKVKGVENIKINLLCKKASADVSADVSEYDIRKTIEEVGYKVKKVEFL